MDKRIETMDDVLFGRPGGKLCLSQADPETMVQIGFWPDGAETVHGTLAALAGVEETLAPGCTARNGTATVARTTFDTYLLIDAETSQLAPELAAVTDLSDARCGVSIEGPAVEGYLARDLAVDLSLAACPVSSVLQTAMHHVPVLLLRVSETRFLLYAYRSYMDDLIDWMVDMALPLEG